ncbi:MAG: hypothetical protein ACJAYU_000228 [Bradymonadia bacterium]
MIDENCLGCHSAGGIGPFPLDDPDTISDWSGAIVDSVSYRRMPPWMPSENGLEILRSRRLNDSDVATFEAWAANGFELGDPSAYTPPVDDGTELRAPDIFLEPEVPYVADPERPDDYRCLSFPMVFEEETLVTGYDVIPGARDVVHHVILYLVPEGDIAQMESLEAQEEGPGYTCYGGSRVGQDQMIAAWVPGANPEQFPDGMAMRIPAGARLVMQVHYNTSQTTGTPPPDTTQVALWTTDEQPERLILVVPFYDFSLNIAAGESRIVEGQPAAIPFDADVIGVVPHMHTLGHEIRGFLTTETVSDMQIFEIPKWDFNWQQFYWFHEADTMPVSAGEQFRIECIYDNSAANQAVVNGEILEPRDVQWGEGTFDEMCIIFMLVSVPAHPSNGGLCGGFETCVQECEDDDAACFMTCAFTGGFDCISCVFDEIEPCVRNHCIDAAVPFIECDDNCDDEYGCNTSSCKDEFSTLLECVLPQMKAGACNDGLAECDIAF